MLSLFDILPVQSFPRKIFYQRGSFQYEKGSPQGKFLVHPWSAEIVCDP